MRIGAFSAFKNVFKGRPAYLEQRYIGSYQDALSQWEELRHAKYSDIHSDYFEPSNREIRKQNYSFLDKVWYSSDKIGFISAFCELTGFPNLEEMSKKMDKTYRDCLTQIVNRYHERGYWGVELLHCGYDRNCSVGLKKAFVGSDVDKGYAVFYNGTTMDDKTFTDRIKGDLWENLDQRFVSLNHPNTFPDIYTNEQIKKMLDLVCLATLSTLCRRDLFEQHNTLLNLAEPGTQLHTMLLIAANRAGFDKIKNSDITEPYAAAKFNREVSANLNPQNREAVKNFAFFIETLMDNLTVFPPNTCRSAMAILLDKLKSSDFVRYSNVNQINAWRNRILGGYLKSKLRSREKLEREFPQMSVDEKYELIKDVIKSSSNDQSEKFSQFFKNDDDIHFRYQKLLESLK